MRQPALAQRAVIVRRAAPRHCKAVTGASRPAIQWRKRTQGTTIKANAASGSSDGAGSSSNSSGSDGIVSRPSQVRSDSGSSGKEEVSAEDVRARVTTALAPAFEGLKWLWQWLLLPWRKLGELLMYIPTVAAARRLKELEDAAEAAPEDPKAQRAYLMELNQKHPERVLEHMQSGKYATDSLVVKEYMKVQ